MIQKPFLNFKVGILTHSEVYVLRNKQQVIAEFE